MFRMGPKRHIRVLRRSLSELVFRFNEIYRRKWGSWDSSPGDPMPYSLRYVVSDVAKVLNRMDSTLTKDGSISLKEVEKLNENLNELHQELDFVSGPLGMPRGQMRESTVRGLQKTLTLLDKASSKLRPSASKFQKELERILIWCELTPYGLGRLAQVDESYMYKLIKGEKSNPSRSVVTRLAESLQSEFPSIITHKYRRRLLKAAGYRDTKGQSRLKRLL